MAITHGIATAIHICVVTKFSPAPKDASMRRGCWVHLKNSATCQRGRYKSLIDGQDAMALVVAQALLYT